MCYSICVINEKISCLQNKKMRKKNQISEYHVSSPKRLIKTIHRQSSNKKPFNLVEN